MLSGTTPFWLQPLGSFSTAPFYYRFLLPTLGRVQLIISNATITNKELTIEGKDPFFGLARRKCICEGIRKSVFVKARNKLY